MTSPCPTSPSGETRDHQSGPKLNQRLLVSAVLIAAIVAAYWSVTGYGFVSIDDFEYVRDNPNVNSGFSWENIKWAFTHPVAGNWHPLTMLSHMLDCQLYGLRAGGHHLTNILLHISNTLLLFWLLLRMTDKKPNVSYLTSTLWPCALIAALFALHPLRVESVAWISERKDVLSGFFFLLTLWAYVRYTEEFKVQSSRFKVFYASALLFFALGLMSKPMLVTLPCVLLLLDYWPLQRPGPGKSLPRLFLEKIPFFALAAIFSVITVSMQKRAGAVVTLEEFPLKYRIANALISYARYLGKTFWPDSLTVLYPQHNWSQLQVASALALFVGLSVLALWLARRKPYVFVGWFLFAGMLLPVSGLFQAGEQAMADRFCYLPLIGIFIALIWGLTELPLIRKKPGLIPMIGFILLLLLLTLSSIQAKNWRDSKTLFTHAIQVTPENSTAHHYLGVLLLESGDNTQAQQHFSQAIQYNPMNVKAHSALGYIYADQGRLEEARQEYETALRIEPGFAKAHVALAEIFAKLGRPDLAVNHYVEALKSNPNIPEAHLQLGSALLSGKQDTATAINYLENAVHLAPDWPLALNALAWTLATHSDAKYRDGAEATRLALRAVALTKGNDPGLLDTLAAAYAEAGQFTNAVQTEETAILKANAAGQTKMAAEFESHRKLFQSQQAFHE